MQICLRMLGAASWCSEPIVGARPLALLHALLASGNEGASVAGLIDAIWEDNPPANPRKALQVLVSRLRSATADRLIERTTTGYRLGLNRNEVDIFMRDDLAQQATDQYAAGHIISAATTAQRALDLGPSAAATRVFGLASSSSGNHSAAQPALEESTRERPNDEGVFAALLRSVAQIHGPAAALERYDAYRQRLMTQLGNNPGPAIQSVHRELIGTDQPGRSGVHYDANALLGRTSDLSNLTAHLSHHRLVSILGPGGIGKTRLAHALARKSTRPVYFVELATAASAEQVIGTIAATLGVRPVRPSRPTPQTDQRTDLLGHIAQHLDQMPTLLVLDNCEHVIDTVADSVAYFLASVSDLQVLTTSRTPLRIAAEQGYPLPQLSAADAQRLFRERALAARPSTVLDDGAIADVVRRLDGLPLAIELAAAQVRTMAVTEITRRLDNRFELLQGGDRSAPDRHRTLLAVIDWSWNLLTPAGQNALMRLSLFRDGFSASCAESVLGPDAAGAVAQLVDQSLLGVSEDSYAVRYRMLETVRELAYSRLAEAGLAVDTRSAERAWAREVCTQQRTHLHGPGQLSAAALLRSEEANLTDALRQAFAATDRDTALILLAALASFWTITGNHLRLGEFFGPVEQTLTGWDPPKHLVEPSRQALSVLATTAGMLPEWFEVPQTHRVLAAIGSASSDPFVRAMCLLADVLHTNDPGSLVNRLEALTSHPERFVAMSASALLASLIENSGDPALAVTVLMDALSLARAEDGPWLSATYQMMLAQLHIQLGNPTQAAPHARNALTVLELLAPVDDALQCRAILAIADLSSGNVAAAATGFAVITDLQQQGQGLDFGLIITLAQAELAFAQGRVERGLVLLQTARTEQPSLGMPDAMASGLSPWSLLTEGTVLAAYARHGGTSEGDEIARPLTVLALKALEPQASQHDYPVLGTVLFGLAAWSLRVADQDLDVVARLLALAQRFSYNRFLPSLQWQPLAEQVQQRAPGLLAQQQQAVAGVPRSDLLRAAHQAVAATACAGN